MLNVNRPMLRDPGTTSEEASLVDVSRIAAIAKRRWKLVAGITSLFLAFGIAYLLMATPLYMAESSVIIDTQTSQAMQRQDMTDQGQVDTSLVDSQVEILDSHDLATAVVKQLGLDKDPEFVGKPGSGLMSTLMGYLPGGSEKPAEPSADEQLQKAVEAFSHGLAVKRTGLTYVITIDFWSQDKVKAAKIANAVAEAYIKSVLDARFAATRRTGDWLEARLQDIRKQANDADRALQTFKSSHNIIDTNRGLVTEQQLSELNSSLATASAGTAEAKAKLDRAREISQDPIGSATVSDAINNPVISRLRAQFLDLSNKASDLAARYGNNHKVVVDLRNQMAQIKKSVQDEVQRITDGYDSDYRIAKARQDALQASMDKMVSQNDSGGLDRVKLQDLESTADSLRALYNGYLQRFQEATQRESFPIADARVIERATPPLKKGAPKNVVVLAGALGLGLLVGGGAAFARELVNSFVTPEDIESHTGLPCLGILPLVGGAGAPIDGAGRGEGRRSVDSVVLDAPFSRYAETIRHIKISIDTIQGGKGAQVVAVTSAVPNEGKTTVAINLAQLIANSGNRVLVIDADLSNRRLTERLGAPSRTGILEVLADVSRLQALVQRDPRSGLDILHCASDSPIPHRAELLASDQMAALLSKARERYQYVILDLAPIVPVVDAKAVARMVDCFVMVVEWRQTSRKVVAEALASESIHQRTIGVVLNKVDPHTLQQMESYKGKAINSYYIDDKYVA